MMYRNPSMSIRRTSVASLRIAVAFAAMLSFVLAPVASAMCVTACPVPGSAPAPIECGDCCGTPACCIETPTPTPAPKAPPASAQAGLEFSVALMAANRPLLWRMPVGDHDFVSQASTAIGLSAVSLSLLCIRLI